MLEQELKEIWQHSSEGEQIKFKMSKLMIDMEARVTRMERNIKNRDRREIIASLIGIPLFGYFAYEIPFLVTKIACVFAVLFFVYVIYKLKNAQKLRSSIDVASSFSEQLEAQRNYLKEQSKLLDNVLYWYVLPPFIMNIVFILGLGDPVQFDWNPMLLEYLPITPKEKLSTIIMLALFYGFIVLLNKSAVKINYKPVIQDIEQLQLQLKSEN